ncbi:methionine--tRNA ligase [Candidatus Micrarchaeota archaeon]|nr:methionine--tRNA ligase [Candidatus Micrarchaeota archaeon]
MELLEPEKKRLITSALPYVNNVPHLGNIIGCVLSADVFARFCRSRGYNTLFICGTDEYGTATETKAIEENCTPQEICDKYHKLHRDIYEWFEISTDSFGRTSTPKHTEITQDIFLGLYSNGYITEEEVEQPFDEKAGISLADRYIIGTCPFCGFEDARGDQCDKCGKLLSFNELLNPKSRITGTTPVLKKSKHLFIDLPKIQNELESWIDKSSKEGFWSENSYNIAKSWLKEGLKRRAITRDLKWGVPVPLKGYEKKVFYVWFDAPIGYISITANHTERWKDWWLSPEDTRLFQFMGKDNVPFHTVIFPSSLIGSGKKWTLLHHISTTEYLNYESGKFSKSRGIGVFGLDAIETGIPADVWRYYLLINRPEQADTQFTWDDFGEKLNNELVANIGNLVNRTLVFIKNKFGGTVPKADLNDDDKAFLEECRKEYKMITASLENVKLKEALKQIMSLSKHGNQYFQKNKPWESIRTGDGRAEASMYVLVNLVKDLAILLGPYLPATSRKIFEQLDTDPKNWTDLGKLSIRTGHEIWEPEILFNKIDEKQLNNFKDMFSGEEKKEESQTSFSRFDIEVGEVLSAEVHPDAEKLYVEVVRMSEGKRQLVSGLVPHIEKEKLIGKKVLIVKNLKPAKIRGALSQGMLLVAENNECVEVLDCRECEVGDKAYLEGEKQSPAEQITIDEFFSVKIEVKNHKLYVDGKRILAGDNEITTVKVRDGKVC